MSTYDRIETDNPLLDEIIYSSKLIMKSCVLKSEDLANKNETLESARMADTYRAIMNGTVKLYLFDVSVTDMTEANLPTVIINEYYYDINNIPEPYYGNLLKYMSDYFLLEYQELNNYYRKLAGLAPLGEEGIYLTEEYMSKYNISIDLTNPVHMMSTDEKSLLKDLGVIDDLIKTYPDKYYLKYLTYNIDPSQARLAQNFGLIYVDDSLNPILLKRFKDLFDKNRVYFDNMMNIDAYKIYSDYYERIIALIIISQTVVDMIVEIPDYFIRREVFDIRTCEYFCEANGVKFFKDIPLKYQTRLVKNLNTLIKYKSTTKNIIDICSLFGFKDIKIFKYFLMKIHKKDSKGLPMGIDESDLNNTYDLKFVKVPLEKTVDGYYNNHKNLENYESLTSLDPDWNGPYSEDFVKQHILKQEFNIVQSKYMSIDAVYSLANMSFEASYFINMIMYSGINMKTVSTIIPSISSTIKMNIFDLLMYLYALTYNYQGIEDTIIYDQSATLCIRGFNFDANMTMLSEYVMNKGYTLKELGVDGFMKYNGTTPLTIGQMISIYINNKGIHDHLAKGLKDADTKEIYDCYKKLYDALVVSEMNYDLFNLKDLDREAVTYTEFLQYNNSTLYNRISQYNLIEDEAERQTAIYKEIDDVSMQIIDWIDNDNLTHIFSQFPTINSNYVKHYMYEIINFFKYHKISIQDLNNIYTFDEDKVKVIDKIMSNISTFDKTDMVNMADRIGSMTVTMTKEDRKVTILDFIEISYNYD